MRLSSKEITVLKEKLFKLSPHAKIYLFGSRTDDFLQGGDIDLLVVSDCLPTSIVMNTYLVLKT